jgi:hypothetical protein
MRPSSTGGRWPPELRFSDSHADADIQINVCATHVEGGAHMKLGILILVILSAWAGSVNSRENAVPDQPSATSPTETIERLWIVASAGELLTPTGWQNAAGLFTEPLPPPEKTIHVFSNDWGLDVTLRGKRSSTVRVIVGCWELGTIDSEFRFVPAPRTNAVKEGQLYHLAFAPSHSRTIKNGRLVQGTPSAQPVSWQISEPLRSPFTTVNGAIRYVLAKRDQTGNSALRQNADDTLARLLQLH